MSICSTFVEQVHKKMEATEKILAFLRVIFGRLYIFVCKILLLRRKTNYCSTLALFRYFSAEEKYRCR